MRFLPVGLMCNLWNRSPFLSPCTLLHRHAGSGEVRRLTSESASHNEKKDDTAYTMQNSHTSFVRGHGRYEEEGRRCNARERTIIARTRQYLERSYSVKAQVEELEALLGPEDVDVDLRRSLREARDEQGRRIFETFSSNDMSFLVADWSRWNKYKRAPWRHDSSASAGD